MGSGPLHRAKFLVYRGNVSPLRGEKPIFVKKQYLRKKKNTCVKTIPAWLRFAPRPAGENTEQPLKCRLCLHQAAPSKNGTFTNVQFTLLLTKKSLATNYFQICRLGIKFPRLYSLKVYSNWLIF